MFWVIGYLVFGVISAAFFFYLANNAPLQDDNGRIYDE